MPDLHSDRRTVWRQAILRGVATAVICAVVWRLLDSERTLLSALLFGLVFGLIQIAWSLYTAPQARRQARERRERHEERAAGAGRLNGSPRREQPPRSDEGNEGR